MSKSLQFVMDEDYLLRFMMKKKKQPTTITNIVLAELHVYVYKV